VPEPWLMKEFAKVLNKEDERTAVYAAVVSSCFHASAAIVPAGSARHGPALLFVRSAGRCAVENVKPVGAARARMMSI